MGELFRRLHYLLNRRKLDEELQSDMAFHREMAAREGRNNFGNTLRLREQARESWGWTWIDRLIQDLSYAARMLIRSPGFTFLAVMVLALGVGVNIAAFSLFNAALIKLLPIRDPESIVRLQRRSPDASTNVLSYPAMSFYREHAKSLQAVIGTMGGRLVLNKDIEPVGADFVTENYFVELGEPPALGRLLDPVIDGKPDASPVAVLSDSLWESRFGSDPLIIGKTIHLNNKAATVIGVTSYAFATLGDHHPGVWLPVSQVPYFIEGSTALTNTDFGSTEMWGRLAPGATSKMAEQELLILTNEWRKQNPTNVWDREYIRSDAGGHLQVIQKDIYVLFGMVAALSLLILSVACANLGGLLLARGVSREHEIGIRVAIGAGRLRIFRQLFTESVLLALVGSFAGLLLGYAILRVGMRDAPKWLSATPDWRVLIFALLMALITAVLFGLAPALQIARQRQRKTMARQILVAAQVAGSCVLLIVAGLLVRGVEHVLHADPGFGYEQVISIDPGLANHGTTPAMSRSFLDQLVTRLRSTPGVESVALTSVPPLGHDKVAVITNTIGGHKVPIYPFQVTSEFFETMRIPIVRGRSFLPGEKNAVIVSESLARVQWPGQDPVGKHDASGSSSGDVVVGVAGSARLLALNDGDAVELYHSAQPSDMPDMVVVLRASGALDNLVPVVRSIGQSIDPKLFISIRLVKEEFKRDAKSARTVALAVSLLGLVAVLLAALGLLGMVSYSVSERTKEIAIRIALGAKPWQVLSAILRQFVWPVALGMLAGVSLTAASSKILRQGLYGVNNLDPASYAGAIVLLLLVATAAALIPAKRALGVDPMRALHHD